MPNAKVTATIEVAFEVTNVSLARAALTRLAGDVRHPIEFSSLGPRRTEVVQGTVDVRVVKKTIDGKSV
jgi:hypothetical protein